MRIELLAIALAIPLAAPSLPDDAPSRYATLARGGTLGVAAVHVESGRTESFHGQDRFLMASTFKLPVAVAALRAVDRHALALDAKVVLDGPDVRHGMGRQLGPGTYTLDRLLEAMLVDSDNTATDAVLRLVGGPAAVRAALGESGVAGIDVSRSELQIWADYYGLTVPADGKLSPAALDRARRKLPADAIAAARARFAADPRDRATPEAMAALLVKLQQGKLLSPPMTGRLLGWMRACRTGVARIRAGVPRGTDVAHKTGTTDDLAGDVGLVTLPDGTHVALAVYVKGGRADREKAIAAAARETWEAFARK